MGRSYLGEFEELVLLTVAHMKGEAYGAGITQDIKYRTGRTAILSAVHVALYRLEEKGLVTSSVGGATQERWTPKADFYHHRVWNKYFI